MAIDKINLVNSSIKCLESNLSSLVDTIELGDIIKGAVLTEIINKKEFDPEDIDFLNSLVAEDDIEYVTGTEFFDLMFQMTSVARERSHGAAPLSKVYINPDLYNNIKKESNAKEISICKVKLDKLWFDFDRLDILGVCKNKYGSSRYQDLLIGGTI